MISAETVKKLRKTTGDSLMECKSALERAAGDYCLAAGILKYDGKAINIKPAENESRQEARDRWVMEQARAYTNRCRQEFSHGRRSNRTNQ